MSISNEKQRLTALAKGDEQALKELFFVYHPPLFRRIFSIVRDRNLADDLSQQVFIRLWEKRKALQIHSNFAAYLMKMGVNEALGHLRQEKAPVIPLENHLDQRQASEFSDDGIRAEEQNRKIQKAIAILPARCRAVFLLSRQEQLTYQEIAITLDISKKTVEAQMGKALMLLRKNLLTIFSLISLHFYC